MVSYVYHFLTINVSFQNRICKTSHKIDKDSLKVRGKDTKVTKANCKHKVDQLEESLYLMEKTLVCSRIILHQYLVRAVDVEAQ